ncbi:MAG TPA: hypothetical protein VN701_00270 [Candidatus Paceibacterota bacterium]|nr:hypothetical protein [Candidatus Paceibacterota bacterium]
MGAIGSVLKNLNKYPFGDLPDDTLICRGGGCTAQQFIQGAESVGSDGSLSGVSVRVGRNGESAEELLQSLPKGFGGQGKVINLGQLKSAGVTLEQEGTDAMHGVMDKAGPSAAEDLEALFESGEGLIDTIVGEL